MKSELQSNARAIIGDVLIGIFLLLLLNVSVVMLRRISAVNLKGNYRTIFRYELVLCAILLAFAFDVRFGFQTIARHRAAKAVGWVCRIAIVAMSGVILFYAGQILLDCAAVSEPSAEYAIVLGMALENGKPTKDLLYRVDAAQSYLNSHPDSTLVLTGGNASEAGQTEAEVMRRLLLARGVSEDKMLLEDNAETTKENFINVAKLIDPSASVVIVSSNYHMDRAMKTARKAGFTNVLGWPARSDPLCFGSNVMWEIILELNGI